MLLDMKEIRRRKLSEAIKIAGSSAKLSVASGISPSAISQMRSGKHDRNIGEKAARAIEAALLLPHGWMDQAEENIPRKIESNAVWLGQMEPWDSDTPLDDDEVELPFFREVEASAGGGSSMVQENHGCKLRFSKNTLKKYSVQAEHAYCITVSGNSMEPAILDGATIGVDTGKTIVVSGDIYAIDHDGHLRVKVVYKMPTGVRLKSFNNEEWPDESYTHEEAEKIKILGRVFWWSVLR